MANKFVIEVRAKGFKNLEGELNRASAATRGYEKATTQLRGSTSGLRRQIGAIRNNILLYTFAIGGAIKAVSIFVKTASKFEQVRTRLVGLTGSVVKANRAFETFNAVAATTPFSLEDVADAGAQLKAFGADAEALIKPITDLAAFMGTTATEAANSFGRAFAGGAGAADILREKGILNIIKSTQGLTDLANTSLPQFRKALIETLQDPAVGIAGSTDRMSQTFQGAFSNMNDSVSRLSAEIGDTMLPTLKEAAKDIGSLADRVGDYIRSFTESEAEAMLRNLKAIGVETKALTALEVLVFKEQTVKRIEGMNKGIADILEKNPKLKDTFDRFGDFDQKVKKVEGFRDFLGEIRNVTITSEKAAELLEVLGQQMNLTEIDALGMAESVGKSNQATSEATQEAKDQFMALASLIAILTQQDLTYKQLAETIAELSATAPPVLVDPKDEKLILRQARAFKQFSDNIATAIVHGQNLGDAVVNSLKAIAAELAAQAISFAILNMITGGGASASKAGFNLLGAVFPSLGHSGGAVTKNGVQAFGGGGVVQGGDNVPILAQAGEFIMRREAVQNIGLDQLHQMNQTGQSNNLTVNISAPMIDETVVDHIIPAIEKAARFDLA